jgi:hypothetical protein
VISLFICKLKHVPLAVVHYVIVVHIMFAEVHNNTGIGNTRRIAMFPLTPVTMQELTVADSHQRPEFFQRCCQGGPPLRLEVLNKLPEMFCD